MMEPLLVQDHKLRKSITRGDLHDVIHDLWQKLRIDWSLAGEGISDALRKRRLGGRERRYALEVIYGMVRHLRRVDEALRHGGIHETSAGRDSLRIRAYLLGAGAISIEEATEVSPEVDWERVAGIEDALRRERDPIRRLALSASLPDWLADMLHAELGREAEAVMEALNQRAPLTVRVNTLRVDRERILDELSEAGIDATPGAYSATAAHIAGHVNVRSLPAFRRGDIELQDEASQVVGDLVDARPEELIVDLCAGAGGKTLALAAAMRNRGRLIAADTDERKLRRLRKRARRAGVTNVQAVLLPPSGELTSELERQAGRCDRVLVDAPCSALGTLRRHPEVRWRLQPAEVERYPRTQRAIAERAVTLLRPKGRLVYATCTLLAAENRDLVDAFCHAHGELSLLPVAEVMGAEVADESGQVLEMLPHRHGTDGFFAAVCHRD